MRFLLILVAVLSVLYGGYWFMGRSVVERGVEGFIAGMERDGWDIRYSDLSTGGFPSRFDTTIRDVSLVHLDSGVGWSAPLFQLFALSYRPNEVIAILPADQTVSLPGDRLTVTSEGMRASAGIELRLAAPLDKVTVESGPMRILSEHGWQAMIDRTLFAFRKAGPAPTEYDVFLETESITLPDGVIAMIDPTGSLPSAVDLLRTDARVALNQPLDRNMAGRVLPTMIDLREFQMTWGDIGLNATGMLTVAPDGTPEGQIMLAAQNWRQLIALGVASGVIPATAGRLAERAGGLISGGSDTLSAPLSFTDGQMSLGPIPLGAAPRL